MKRLYRSETDRKISGVCGGLAEYMELDPVLIRAGYAFVTVITGVLPGLIAYVVLVGIMPTKSEIKEVKNGKKRR